MTEETQENHIDYTGDGTRKLVAGARPKQTLMPTTSPTVTLPYHLREWVDVEPGKYDESCFRVSKKMIRLLRQDPSVLREEGGAVEFRILAPMFRSAFTSYQYWSIRTWLNYLQKGRGPEKRFQSCVDPCVANTDLYLRAVQGHTGVKHINPTLQDNVLLPSNFADHIHAPRWKLPRYAFDHSIRIGSGWQRRQEGETCGVFLRP